MTLKPAVGAGDAVALEMELDSLRRELSRSRQIEADLRSIIHRARCLLWEGDIVAPEGWRLDEAALDWKVRWIDVQAAMEVLPLDIQPGSTYLGTWWSHIPDDDKHRMNYNSYQALLRGDKTYSQEYRCENRFGQEQWLHENVYLENRGVDRWHAVGVCTDISDRRRAEQDIQSIVAHARCIIWRSDIFGLPGWQSEDSGTDKFDWHTKVQDRRAAQEVLAIELPDQSSSYEQAWNAAVHAEDRARIHATATLALQQGLSSYTQEYRCMNKFGQLRWLHETVSLTRRGEGRWHAVGVVTDITESKQAETLKAARDAAEGANRAKDHFLAVLSHELRTPLTPVLARVSLLQRDTSLSADLKSSLATIRRNVELEARLIDDLLDITRISEGKLQLKFEPVDAHIQARHAVEVYQSEIDAKGLRVSVDLSAKKHFVSADPARLQQVLWNLIGNAVKYTPDGGSLRVRSENRGERLCVEVSDSGIGIDPQVMPRIFNAFEQGEQSLTRRYGGLGLGLTISKRLVDMHSGSLSAASQGRGMGAIFTLLLPTVPAPAPATSDTAPPVIPAPPTERQRLRILLVDDHADTLRALSRILRGAGHDVITATCVDAALATAQDAMFDLLISDIGLPDGSGIDLMNRLGDRRPKAAFVLSGFGAADDILRSQSVGFSEHLTKPVNIDVLEAAIARVTRVNSNQK